MTQSYANIPGFPGYTAPAAPAFPPGPVPAVAPVPVPAAPVPVPPIPAGYAPVPAYPAAAAPAMSVPSYPAAPAGPVPAAVPGYPQPAAAPAAMPPLPDLNAAIAAATIGADKYTPLREFPGTHTLKIVDHQRRCGISKRTQKYFDVLAVDLEFVSSTNPACAVGTKTSHAFAINATGHRQTKEMECLKTFTHGVTSIPLVDPRIDGVTGQVYRALAALDGQKPYVGYTLAVTVQQQANGKLDSNGKPYMDVKFKPAQ